MTKEKGPPISVDNRAGEWILALPAPPGDLDGAILCMWVAFIFFQEH